MPYSDMLRECEDTEYLINMIPIRNLLKTGLVLGLNAGSNVLDLCCGYGTLLKIWAEAFGIRGTGVDIAKPFVEAGTKRMRGAGIETVALITGDATQWESADRYDVVCCSETLGTEEETLRLMERHLEPGGKLMCHRLFTKTENPPKELIDFDGPLKTLEEHFAYFRSLGYYVANIASDDRFAWDHYISWSARRNLQALREGKNDAGQEQWYDKWFHMYFAYRRAYEGMALFVLEKL